MMKSTQQKIAQCTGLIGTNDLTQWEEGFIQSLEDEDDGYEFSEKQLKHLDQIYNKHFA